MVSGIIKEAHDSAVESNQREVLRVTSPDGRLDAVFVRPIFSFLGYGSALYIVLRGESAPGWGPLVRGTAFNEPPKLAWSTPQLLLMQFDRGCVDRFANLWHSYDVDDGKFHVEIRLEPASGFTCLVGFNHGQPSAQPRVRR